MPKAAVAILFRLYDHVVVVVHIVERKMIETANHAIVFGAYILALQHLFCDFGILNCAMRCKLRGLKTGNAMIHYFITLTRHTHITFQSKYLA
jgi:hypothetical protein